MLTSSFVDVFVCLLCLFVCSRYLVNYAPFDFVYKLCKFTPVKLGISFLKEIHRAHGVHLAILFALKNFPGSYFLVCVFGVLKGRVQSFLVSLILVTNLYMAQL